MQKISARPWPSVGVWLLVVAAFVASRTVLAEPVPPPAGAELEAATAAVKGIYQDKAEKARTPADRAALAREIFGNRETTANLAERYAVGMTALNLATRSDDPMLLMAICDDMAANFKIDRIGLFTERVGETTGPINPKTWPQLLEKLNAMVSTCLDTNRFAEAGQVVTAITQLAKRARDSKAAAAAAALRKSIADRKKARERYDELSEAANRLDAEPKVLLELGRLLCFTQGNWAEGVRYLARCDDPALAAAADAEVKAITPEGRLTAADAWAKYAAKAAVADREVVRDHAASIYGELIPALTGLAKVRAEKALDDVLAGSQSSKDNNAWMVIFRSDNPKIWNTHSPDDPRNFAVQLDSLPPTIRFVRIRRGNGQAVIAPINKQRIGSMERGPRYGWEGSKPERWGALLLGIIDNEANVYQKTGEVALVDSGRDCCSGWGFGTRVNHGTQAVCWGGKWIAAEPLEIAVAKRSLSPDEQKLLLE